MGRVVRVGLGLAALVGLWFFARQLQPAKLGAALAHARLLPVALAVAFAFGSALCRSVYWTVALAPRARVPVWASFRLALASVVASLVNPRAGDVLKVWQLKKQFGVDVPSSIAVSLLEKLEDILSMLLIVAPLPWLLPHLPASVQRSLAIFWVGLVVLVGALLVAAHHPRWSRLRWLSGLSLLRAPRLLAWSFFWILGAWLCALMEIRLAILAVGAPVGLGAALLMILFVNLANIVPISPGNAGVQEFGAVLALTIAGASAEVALAAALLFHATQTVPIVLASFVDSRALLAGRLRLAPALLGPA
jgi:glycosyltransferase 2 family protein